MTNVVSDRPFLRNWSYFCPNVR